VKKWEYDVVDISSTAANVVSALNMRGKEGWRRVDRFKAADGEVFLMEREIPGENEVEEARLKKFIDDLQLLLLNSARRQPS
jgi:hypothetical protein